MSVWAALLAAGQGARLASASGGPRKQFLLFQGKPLYWHSALVLAKVPRLSGLVFVFPPEPDDDMRALEKQIVDLNRTQNLGLPWRVVAGGERRQDSARRALAALPGDCARVLIHDAARPFLSAAMVERLLAALDQGAPAAIPAVPVKDTIKEVENGRVRATPARESLWAVQTPQAFVLSALRQAHERAKAEGFTVTDDASMLERLGLPVVVVAGEEKNVKITTPEDLRLLKADRDPLPLLPCAGWGYDVHRFVSEKTSAKRLQPARALKIGGIPIPGGPDVHAHSDGDVLLHALTDALLSLIGQGDIGGRFPDNDPNFENMNSALFVNEVLQDLMRAGVRLTHVDCTIIAQVPRLSPHAAQIRQNVAGLLKLDPGAINVKATTEEGLGFTGEKKGLKAVVLVSGLKPALGAASAAGAKTRQAGMDPQPENGL